MAVTKSNVPTDLRSVRLARLSSIEKGRHEEMVRKSPVYETTRFFLEHLPQDLEREGVYVVQVLKVVLEQAAKAATSDHSRDVEDALSILRKELLQ